MASLTSSTLNLSFAVMRGMPDLHAIRVDRVPLDHVDGLEYAKGPRKAGQTSIYTMSDYATLANAIAAAKQFKTLVGQMLKLIDGRGTTWTSADSDYAFMCMDVEDADGSPTPRPKPRGLIVGGASASSLWVLEARWLLEYTAVTPVNS